ncbi:MAG: hypothetical protein JRJ87_04110 [Deltaproteobacteria bacterium]|nr:hypothetical protein [Deltaproteobacteria bacterium]
MSQEYIFYGIFGVSVVLGLVRVIYISFSLKINVGAFVGMIKKLVMANNVDRAMKLCKAAPAAVATRGTYAMLEAFQNRVTDSVALREAFEHGVGGLNNATGKLGWLSYLALLATCACAGWAYQLGYDPLHPIYRVGLAALLIAIAGIRMGSTLKNTITGGRDQTILALQEASLMR